MCKIYAVLVNEYEHSFDLSETQKSVDATHFLETEET